jgi:nitroreductase
LITAVFGRMEWKYPSPRAYRDVLLEAGHFCQTFCLVATSLGLAPFCTGALADSIIERDLGLDGVSESVLYACGAGTRPPKVRWAPWPEDADRIEQPISAGERRTVRGGARAGGSRETTR